MNLPKTKKLHFLLRVLLMAAAIILIAATLFGLIATTVAVFAIFRPERSPNGPDPVVTAIITGAITIATGWLVFAINRLLKADTAARTPLKYENNPFFCRCCGKEAPSANVRLSRHIGMIILMQHTSIDGRVCKPCIYEKALNFSLITLFFGWWGLASFFITPFVLVGNLFAYLSGRKLSSQPITAGTPTADKVDPMELLKMKDLIDDSLKNGTDVEELSKHIAATVGTTPARAYQCLCDYADPALSNR